MSRFSNKNIGVVDPFAVRMSFDSDACHLDCLLNFFFITIGKRTVEGRVEPEYAVVIVRMTREDDVLDLIDFLQSVVIAVEVSCGVMIGFAGPRISFGRTGEKGNYEEKRIYLKILQD